MWEVLAYWCTGSVGVVIGVVIGYGKGHEAGHQRGFKAGDWWSDYQQTQHGLGLPHGQPGHICTERCRPAPMTEAKRFGYEGNPYI